MSLELFPGDLGVHALVILVFTERRDSLGAMGVIYVDVWAESTKIQPPEDLVQAAIAAIARIRSGESELRGLWDGSEEWHTEMDGLLAHLRAGAPTHTLRVATWAECTYS